MSASLRIAGLAVASALACQAATQAYAAVYRNAPALGPRIAIGSVELFAPWSLVLWRGQFPQARRGMKTAASAFLLAFVAGGGLILAADGSGRVRRIRGWGGLKDAREAGLLENGGCILGELEGRLLATRDLRPTLVTGGTRSGKGRGHVIPTLLSWTDSALVHDPKGELWTRTAGWRAGFSHVVRLDPRSDASARFNPLAEIRPGPQALAEVQRLTAILSDPAGRRDDEAIWDKAASEILSAVILHVLFTAPDDDKTLVTVRRLLADLDATADEMVRTLHRAGPDGEAMVDPFIATAARGYAAMHDRFRTSVQGTARSYLSWLAGDDLDRLLSASDLRLSDLMCADAPVSLYIQVSPADAAALRPLIRLLFQAAAQALTAHEDRDPAGRPKRRALLMVMDEFPLLGRLGFFEKSLRLMSGYGIKTLMVAQSLNDIVETYGPHNTILDNCHVYTAFSALDPLTQDKVSKLTGTVIETRVGSTAAGGLGATRTSRIVSEVDRPLLEPGEVRALPDGIQLTFAAGRRPLRTRKVRYDRRRPFRQRADVPPPDAGAGLDVPPRTPHPWTGMRGLGIDPHASLPLFKEVEAAIHDKRVAAGAAERYGKTSMEFAEQQASLDFIQELGRE